LRGSKSTFSHHEGGGFAERRVTRQRPSVLVGGAVSASSAKAGAKFTFETSCVWVSPAGILLKGEAVWSSVRMKRMLGFVAVNWR
jgi:hypothetical protein